LFVSNLSFDTTESSLSSFFEAYGTLTKCKLLRGKAFVEFETHEAARNALENTNEQQLDGRNIRVEFSGQSQTFAGGDAPETNTVFCGNLGFYTTEDSIRAFFSQCGTVTTVRIAMNEEGRARGFCHVEFSDPSEAKAAMGLAGQALDGRPVRLDLSVPKQGGGGGRGGGFGGRGGDRGRGFGGRGGGFGGRGGDRGRGFGGRGGSRGGRGGFPGQAANRGSIVGFEGKRQML
jgi:nucleolin